MTSNRSDLTSRLQRRLETERTEIEATAERELKVLGESLRSVASSALRTIEADTVAATGRMRGMLLRAWLWPLVAGLSLSVGICGGSWAAMRWLGTAIEWKVETLAALNVDIEQARETLTAIEETTWGLELREIDGARFVAAAGGLAAQSALDRGRAACREAVERVKDLYDRVRTAVDESLAGVVRAARAGADAARRADRDLAAADRALRRAGDALDRGLQDARRDVARAVELIQQRGRQRGPERDHGPSR